MQEDMLPALLLPANTTATELLSLGMTMNQETEGVTVRQYTLSAYTQMERLPRLEGFLVSLLDQRLHFWICLPPVSSTENQTLASQKMSPKHSSALHDVIKMINHTKLHALNSRLLAQPCEEMNTEHTHLLLYTEGRGRSKGSALASL